MTTAPTAPAPESPPDAAVAEPPGPVAIDPLDAAAAGAAFDQETALAVRRRANLALSAIGFPSADEFEVMQRIATGLADSGMVAQVYWGKPNAIMAILLKSRELRVQPMAGLANIFFYDGKLGMMGALMVALIERAGHTLDFRVRTVERAVVYGKRFDTGADLSIEWTIGMAGTAGLLNKPTWKAYPDAMLTWRAVAALARLLFADVMMGSVYTPDELGIDMDASGALTDWNVTAAKRPRAARAAAAQAAPDAAAPAGAPVAEPSGAAPAEETAAVEEAEPREPDEPPRPTPPMPVLLTIVKIACERLRTKPARLMAGLGVRIHKNYEEATADELWAYLRTDVAKKLREKGFDLPDPDDVPAAADDEAPTTEAGADEAPSPEDGPAADPAPAENAEEAGALFREPEPGAEKKE